jgi:hypothetical protein
MADIHEINLTQEIVPARPTLIEARGEAARLMVLMHLWADACELRHRAWRPGDDYMLSPEQLRQRLRDSGG